MSLDVVGVCNLALSRAGHVETITSLDESSTAAEKCSLVYEHVRDNLLRDFVWGFAKRNVALALVSGGEFVGWDYVYRYPSDCLSARQVCDAAGCRMRWYDYNPSNDDSLLTWMPPKVPYQVSGDDDGKTILTDMEEAYLVYTKRMTDTNLMDDSFLDLWAWSIAMEIAPSLRAKSAVISFVANGYQSSRIQAETLNMNEMQKDADPESPAIQARY